MTAPDWTGHHLVIDVTDLATGIPAITVHCPHDPTDPHRPCTAGGVAGDTPIVDDDECDLAVWVSECAAAIPDLTVRLPILAVTWNGDYPTITTGSGTT